MTPTRFVNADRAARRFGPHRVRRMAEFLLEGDPLADAAVDALAGRPAAEQESLVARVLAGAREGLGEPLAALEASLSRAPLWFDPDRADRGGAVLLRHGLLSGLSLGFKSLVAGYCSPAGNKPLAFSARLTEDTTRRLGETARFVEAVCLPRGLSRGGDGFAAAVRVRLMHARVRAGLRRSPRWQSEAWGLPINQYDMAGTILLFSHQLVDGLRQLGAVVTAEEEADVFHLWRAVGAVMGVDAELLPTCRADADLVWALIDATQGPPDEDSRRLTNALIDSAKARGAPEAYVAFTRALTRHFVGKRQADALGLPAGPWSLAPSVVRSFIRPLEVALRRVPGGRGAALKAGMLYWRRTVEQGDGALTNFPLPAVERFA
ncbi:MAG: DUF2236 domain-containing protein [Myxococcaceae bacterium]|jgi:hypothetical protein|nr:DUF2236 domain-containing protein [Myxococcaceae bacterium]MCA3011413.1 DUF2236 domain-containing protein [Myxococcaceae bacterium]